jgi:predicted nuclease of predicted toxin-antitoxin system
MLKLATDENFNGNILRGLLRQNPHIDVIRVQDTDLYQADDPAVLEWVAKEGRVLLTHDVRTMPGYANSVQATTWMGLVEEGRD